MAIPTTLRQWKLRYQTSPLKSITVEALYVHSSNYTASKQTKRDPASRPLLKNNFGSHLLALLPYNQHTFSCAVRCMSVSLASASANLPCSCTLCWSDSKLITASCVWGGRDNEIESMCKSTMKQNTNQHYHHNQLTMWSIFPYSIIL